VSGEPCRHCGAMAFGATHSEVSTWAHHVREKQALENRVAELEGLLALVKSDSVQMWIDRVADSDRSMRLEARRAMRWERAFDEAIEWGAALLAHVQAGRATIIGVLEQTADALVEARSERDALRAEVSQAHLKVRELEAEVVRLQHAYGHERWRAGELENDLAGACGDRSFAEGERDAARHDVAVLQGHLDAATDVADESRAAVVGMRRHHRRLRGRLLRYRGEVADLRMRADAAEDRVSRHLLEAMLEEAAELVREAGGFFHGSGISPTRWHDQARVLLAKAEAWRQGRSVDGLQVQGVGTIRYDSYTPRGLTVDDDEEAP
jgi:predicted  nucleic acid-binding Zn-ribbon protein